MFTNTYGGRIDQAAVIGHAPESRRWKPGDATYSPLIYKTARVEAFATVDAGAERPTVIGQRSWLMKHSHVGHDARVGMDCEISPGAVVCGFAEIGDGVRIGVNACVLPHVKVGAYARIGAGAVVTKDVPPYQIWTGVPARGLRPGSRQESRNVTSTGSAANSAGPFMYYGDER